MSRLLELDVAACDKDADGRLCAEAPGREAEDGLGRTKNLILLSGLEPGKDIEIKFTGLKQGEKLDEELMEDAAGFAVSEHPDIFILRAENQPSPGLDAHLLELELATRGKDAEAVVRRLIELVPTFRPAAAHTPTPAPRPASPEA